MSSRPALYTLLLAIGLWMATLRVSAQNSPWDSIKSLDVSITGFSQFNCIEVRGDSLHVFFMPASYGVLYYALSPDHGKTWQLEVVDDSSNYGSSLSYFPYKDEYNDTARYVHLYASKEPSSLRFESWRASLKLDSRGRPHICYRAHFTNDSRAGWIRYAYKNNQGKWEKEDVYALTDIRGKFMLCGEVAMTMDKQDVPHVVFGYLYKELTYAVKIKGGWQLKDIPNSDFGNYGLSIVTDKKGGVHIAQGHLEGRGKPYVHNTKEKGVEYFFSKNGGKTWSGTRLSTDCWWETDIAVDTNCVPFVTWRSLSNGIFVAHKEGDLWKTDRVSSVVHGGNPMLCIDRKNNQAYCSSFSNYTWTKGCEILLFGRTDKGNWEKEFVTGGALGNGSASKPGMCFSDKEFFISVPTLDMKQTIFFRKIQHREKVIDYNHHEPASE